MTEAAQRAEAYLRLLVHDFRAWPRCGAERDEPEGARFVHVSDTLLNAMADGIERAMGDLMEGQRT